MSKMHNSISVLLKAIHKLGKESSNFFSSLNKLYEATGKTFIDDENENITEVPVSSPCESELPTYSVVYVF